MNEIVKLSIGVRVHARYRGDGRVIEPTEEMLREPHFDNDYCIAWERGGFSWLGTDALRVERQ